ncbi:hypothetical protein BUALT_Bualt01G0124800 [Buddleja alternifolia]|uniref:Uncharacterized protein n=1 Tax=Buddleja alternifolia TaxID=168488 RepID=A0AAV6YH16_9LAMI|nr:hypothetical protein BUALT_Bualt01G0124800 [Buddleja alternifolia]
MFSSSSSNRASRANGEMMLFFPVSLHSHASSIPLFNGLKFSDWSEQVQFHLGVLDLDISLQVEKPAAITDQSSTEEKSIHKLWERLNRLSLMFMRMAVPNNVKATLPHTESAKEFMKFVEEHSQTADKSLASTLMGTLTNMKFDGTRTMHEHILDMTNVAAKLRTLGMNVYEFFLVQFILNSLPPEQYGPFQMNYNTIKDKWNVNELTSMLIQEETRLKNQSTHSVHFLSHKEVGKSFKIKPGKNKKKGLRNLNESSKVDQIQKNEISLLPPLYPPDSSAILTIKLLPFEIYKHTDYAYPQIHLKLSTSSSNSMAQQYTQQFLNSVLSQRGPTALPYAEDMKWHIRQHLLYLIETYPSLQPKTAVFTHNDGRTVNLLQADGTVPMSFQGVTYNIPVIIWLMESYPRHAPLVFVNPTRDMIIKRPHNFVSPNGVVSIPYIHSWVFPASNLVELARNLSHFFARDPPLYSQRKQSNPNPDPNLNQSYSNLNSSVGSTAARPAIPPRVYSPSPTPTPTPPPYGSGRVMEDPAEVFKKNAINKLVESFNGDIKELRKAREVEMEALFSTQAVLRKREDELRKGVKEMQDEKEALEQQLQMILMNTDIMEGWVRENEGKLGSHDVNSMDVDEAFEPCDALSKQMLDCTASDLAVEDAIYALDKAAQEGAVPFDQYLRSVRLLSREQFFHRATASKVRAIQMQAQVANMASRASPQYAL